MEQAGEVDYLITWRDNEFVQSPLIYETPN